MKMVSQLYIAKSGVFGGPPGIAALLKIGIGMVTRIVALLLAIFALSVSLAGAEPKLRVENVRRAFHNGEHNAFTDLIRWKGRFWLTFRSSPAGHGVNSDAATVILSSDDAKTWRQVHRFSVAERDTRDPHFLIFGEKLFVYSGTAHVGKE